MGATVNFLGVYNSRIFGFKGQVYARQWFENRHDGVINYSQLEGLKMKYEQQCKLWNNETIVNVSAWGPLVAQGHRTKAIFQVPFIPKQNGG